MTIWPQLTMLFIIVALFIGAWVRHGKEITNPKINAAPITWILVMLIILLGNGGFWKPLGW